MELEAVHVVLLIAAAEQQRPIRTGDIKAEAALLRETELEADLRRHDDIRLSLPLQVGLDKGNVGGIHGGQTAIRVGALLNQHTFKACTAATGPTSQASMSKAGAEGTYDTTP